MEKTWTVVGTSVKKGEKKMRFANGKAAARRSVLEKDGHTEVNLFDLPIAMSTEMATKWLEENGGVALPAVIAPRAAKEPRAPKIGAVKQKREQIAEIPAVLINEDMGKKFYIENEKFKILKWEEMDLTTRQEFTRRAMRAAGLPTPKGTFPQLEAWLLTDRVRVEENGDLVAF